MKEEVRECIVTTLNMHQVSECMEEDGEMPSDSTPAASHSPAISDRTILVNAVVRHDAPLGAVLLISVIAVFALKGIGMTRLCI